MKFMVKDADPSSGEVLSDEGIEEMYALEDMQLRAVDFMAAVAVPNFSGAWEEVRPFVPLRCG
jgi:hypothetical protein